MIDQRDVFTQKNFNRLGKPHEALHLEMDNTMHQLCWGLTGWKATLQKRALGFCWAPSWIWVSYGSLQQRRRTITWAALEGVLAVIKGGGSSPLLSTGETHLQWFVQIWAPCTRETWTYWGVRKVKPDSSQRWQEKDTRDNGQKLKCSEFHSNPRGKKCLWLTADWNRLARGAIFDDSQNSARQHPVQPVPGDCIDLDDVCSCFLPTSLPFLWSFQSICGVSCPKCQKRVWKSHTKTSCYFNVSDIFCVRVTHIFLTFGVVTKN